MPQLLIIEVEGSMVGLFSTSNKGGTIYDIRLQVPEIGTDYSILNVDTGVQRQPQDSKGRREDFRNDFIHARRCIAGVVSSAEKLLEQLLADSNKEPAEIKPIIMRLMTNSFDRGIIKTQPNNNMSTNAVVIIGVGANRFPNSTPKDKVEFVFEGINISETLTHTERALEILTTTGPALLQSIEKQISI